MRECVSIFRALSLSLSDLLDLRLELQTLLGVQLLHAFRHRLTLEQLVLVLLQVFFQLHITTHNQTMSG